MRKKRLELLQGSNMSILSSIFANPHMPEIKDYYEPYTFDFSKLTGTKRFRTAPSARPYSLITGKRMEKIEYGPNWEDNLGGKFEERKKDPNLKELDTKGYEEFEKSFMFYVPRLCEHCLNPACAASCPSGAVGPNPTSTDPSSPLTTKPGNGTSGYTHVFRLNPMATSTSATLRASA